MDAQEETGLPKRLSLKGRAMVCTVYIFSLILYRLAVLPLPKASASMILYQITLRRPRAMVHRQVCIQRTRNGGLGMPDLKTHWLAERLVYLG